jgi:hypothetical protein
MQRKPDMITASPYRGFIVQADPEEGYRLYAPIIDNTFEQLDAMMSRHSRVFTFRFDLRYPKNFDNSEIQVSTVVAKLFHQVSMYLKKRVGKPRISPALRNHKDVCYQWAIETGKKNKRHVHCWLAVDGGKNYKPGWTRTKDAPGAGILGILDAKWRNLTGGNIHMVTGSRMLTTESTELYAACIKHYSYLAKVKDKYAPSLKKHSRNHGKSHIKHAGTIERPSATTPPAINNKRFALPRGLESPHDPIAAPPPYPYASEINNKTLTNTYGLT